MYLVHRYAALLRSQGNPSQSQSHPQQRAGQPHKKLCTAHGHLHEGLPEGLAFVSRNPKASPDDLIRALAIEMPNRRFSVRAKSS